MARILIIDDDASLCEMLLDLLESAGHDVRLAGNGEVAVEEFADEPTDLIVVDLFMPYKNGWDTIRELQAIAPGVPCLIVSAGGPLELLRRGRGGTLSALRGRALYRYLRKPFSTVEFIALVDELLGLSAPPTQRTG